MFDLSDETKTRLIKDHPEDRLQTGDSHDKPQPVHKLDKEDTRRRFELLLSYYRQEGDRQSDNRIQQATDADFYDNIQWSEEDAKDVEDRGQKAIVYNVISQSVNWIIGSEKRGRTDFKILPRGKEDAKPAEAKTKYMKYLSDVNRTPFHRSRAFEDQVKVGIGWVESGCQEEDDGEPIYFRYESWRNMLWDSASTELDGSDMRYQFRSKWVDEDIALALFPDRTDKILSAVTTSGVFGLGALGDGDDVMDQAELERDNAGMLSSGTMHRRRRLRLIEAWYRVPSMTKKLRGGAFNGEIYDENHPLHKAAVESGACRVVEKMMMRVRVAIMTVSGMLYDEWSPYRHNRFKFIPIWGYRRDRDGLPYGVIRGMRDIQEDINKRMSKALYILSNNKTIIEEGALSDEMSIDDFADEVARPDAIIVMKNNKLGAIKMDVDRELAPAHLELASRNIQMIQQVGGVTDELLGRTTNAVSGVAVEKRQEQGSLATSKLFDNLRLAVQLHGEIELSLMEQYVTEEKQFRITNQRGTPEFITMNDGLPENDITRTKADFVISEADWRATMRQAALDQLLDMLTKMPPEVAMVMLDLVVESMDVPNRDEIVKRIRAVNGQRDPDATEMTPEEQIAMQSKQMADQAQQAMFEADLAVKQADAQKKAADAKKSEAQIALTEAQTVQANMTGAQSAMAAATQVIQMPTIAKVADNLLQQGGWQGSQPVPTNLKPAAQGMAQPPGMQQAPPQPEAPPAPPEQAMPEQGAPIQPEMAPQEVAPQPQQGV